MSSSAEPKDDGLTDMGRALASSLLGDLAVERPTTPSSRNVAAPVERVVAPAGPAAPAAPSVPSAPPGPAPETAPAAEAAPAPEPATTSEAAPAAARAVHPRVAESDDPPLSRRERRLRREREAAVRAAAERLALATGETLDDLPPPGPGTAARHDFPAPSDVAPVGTSRDHEIAAPTPSEVSPAGPAAARPGAVEGGATPVAESPVERDPDRPVVRRRRRPAPAEPVPTESASSESDLAESASIEPVLAESASIEPVPTESASSEPVLSDADAVVEDTLGEVVVDDAVSAPEATLPAVANGVPAPLDGSSFQVARPRRRPGAAVDEPVATGPSAEAETAAEAENPAATTAATTVSAPTASAPTASAPEASAPASSSIPDVGRVAEADRPVVRRRRRSAAAPDALTTDPVARNEAAPAARAARPAPADRPARADRPSRADRGDRPEAPVVRPRLRGIAPDPFAALPWPDDEPAERPAFRIAPEDRPGSRIRDLDLTVARAEPSADDDGPDTEPERTVLRSVIEWCMVLGTAAVVAIVLQHFVVQLFGIPSESMFPTLQNGDQVMVNKLAYTIGGGVERGDVIVFKRPASETSDDPDQPPQLIKRVIGLPGDVVEARGGVVYIDGEPLEETGVDRYLDPSVVTNNLSQAVTVPAGHVFVMGDNRERSHDSRYFGAIPESDIIGRAVVIAWPFSRWETL